MSIDWRADLRRSSSETKAFSAFRRIAAIGLRISWASPAAQPPIAASRSVAVVRRRASERRSPTAFNVQCADQPLEFALPGER